MRNQRRRKVRRLVKVAKMLTWGPGLAPRNSDSQFPEHSDWAQWRHFPEEHTQCAMRRQRASPEQGWSPEHSNTLFYSVFPFPSHLLPWLFFYLSLSRWVVSQAETNREQRTVISSSRSSQEACTQLCMPITYWHSCQPLVLTLALETIATDQTHLRHLLSIPLLLSHPARLAVPYGLCSPGLPGCLLLLLRLLPFTVSCSPE